MKVASKVTSEDLFKVLDHRDFDSYRELEKEVLKIFNQHLAEIPPRYSYHQLIQWGEQKGWIKKKEEGKYHIEV